MILMETWVDGKGLRVVKERLPEGYRWEVQKAVRKNKKDKTMEGC